MADELRAGGAFVDIVPRVDARAAKAATDKMLRGVTDSAERASTAIDRSMSDTARSAGAALGKVGRQVENAEGHWRDSTGRMRDANGKFVRSTEATGAEAAKAAGKIDAGADKAARGFRGMGDAAHNAGNRMHEGLAKGLTSLRRLAVAGIAGVAVQRLAHSLLAVAEAGSESLALGRVQASQIRATGGAAHVSAAQLDTLTTALSNQIGVDDEAITAGENVLLSFRNIRNETGAGNDIFNQATKAAADLSTVMGGSLTKANLTLGKALNDPVKGLTALGRQGVKFTDQQKRQIEALVRAGDVLGAQKIILGEVGKEFGGAAEAAADPLQRLKVAADNLKEALGGGLLGAIGPVAQQLADLATAMGPSFTVLGESIGKAFATLAPVIADLAKNVIPVLSALADLVGSAGADIGKVLAAAFVALTPVIVALAPPLTDLVDLLADGLVDAIVAIAPVLEGAAEAAVPLVELLADGLTAAIHDLMPSLRIVGRVVADLIGKIGPVLGESLATFLVGILPVLGPLAKAFANLVVEASPFITDFIDRLAPILPTIVRGFTSFFAAATPVLMDGIRRSFENLAPLLPELADSLVELTEALVVLLPELLPLLPPLIDLALIVTKIQLGLLITGIRILTVAAEIARPVIEGIVLAVGAVHDVFALPFSPEFANGITIIRQFFADTRADFERGVDIIHVRIEQLVGFFQDLPGRIAGAAGDVFGFLRDSFITAINAIIDGWNGLAFHVPKVHIPGTDRDIGGQTVDFPDIPRIGGPRAGRSARITPMADGGRVTRGGLALVGELGPELLSLGRGAQVSPLTAEGHGGIHIEHLEVATVADASADEVVAAITAKLGWQLTTRRDH